MNYYIYLEILLIFLLGVVSSFFLAVEFSLITARTGILEDRANEGHFFAGLASKLAARSEAIIVACQLGTLLCLYCSGVLGVLIIYNEYAQNSLWLGLSLCVASFLVFAYGWIFGRSVAAKFPEKTLMFFSLPMYLFYLTFVPVVYLIMFTSQLVLRIFGITPEVEPSKIHSSEEIAELVTQSAVSGELDKSEQEMLHGVIGLAGTVAREIMTPRTDIVAVPVTASLGETMALAIDSGFSRLPVYEGTVDNIIGMLIVRDLLQYLSASCDERAKNQEIFSMKNIMREAYFVPDTKPIDDLLNDFKRTKVHLAIVLDEHGGVDGLVTLEDLLEEIVGDILDESDVVEHPIRVVNEQEVVVSGAILVCDINARFRFCIPEGAYDTIAGFILATLGRMPVEHETIEIHRGQIYLAKNNALELLDNRSSEAQVEEFSEGTVCVEGAGQRFCVEKIEANRIEQVRISIIKENLSGENEQEAVSS
ncbi:MAG: HlyC/CorC family transporter [Deltaproteobacteria bacterium]|nr:HlyC/CorC family transporter [Deltaproteobacteria bacterium]